MATSTGDGDLIGHVLAGYRIEARLGGGSMGAVYRARDVNLSRAVALKVLHPDLAMTPDFVNRFRREARAGGRFTHPHSVQVHAMGEADGWLYLALELVEGRELGALMQQVGTFSVARAVRIAIQILSALGKAHEAGIIHRDVKPANIMVLEQGGDDWIKVLDFGLAKLRGGETPEEEGWKTRTGTLLGTPAYMPPEQATGEAVDARADLYSVGVILYEMLSGERPFLGATPAQVLFKQVRFVPDPIRKRRPEVPAALDVAIAKAIAKPPAARWPDASSMAAALEASLLGLAAQRRETKSLPAALLAPRAGAGRAAPPSAPGAAPLVAPAAEPAVGGSIGRYELGAELGRGATGTVFLARHTALDEPAVIKVVHPALAADVARRERVLREAAPVLDFVHPNAVFVREVGWESGRLTIAQDLAPGQSLRAILAGEGRLEPARALRLVRSCVAALEAAHAAGIVHGRVSASNVLVERDAASGEEVARLADFGCAALGEGPSPAGKLDPFPDVRGVGTLLLELVTGSSTGPSTDFRTLYATDVSPEVDALVRGALFARPGSGPASMQALGVAIDELVRSEARPATARLDPDATVLATRKHSEAPPSSPARGLGAPPPGRARVKIPIARATPPPARDAREEPEVPGDDDDVGFSSSADWSQASPSPTPLVASPTPLVASPPSPTPRVPSPPPSPTPLVASPAPPARRAASAPAPPEGLGDALTSPELETGSLVVLAANWGSNDVVAVQVQPATGAAVGAPRREEAGARPVSITVDARGERAYVANEASNEVTVYSVDVARASLSWVESSVKAGAGAIALVLHPREPVAYVANSRSDDVAVFKVGPRGSLTAAGPTVPAGKNPRSLAIDPAGRFLLVANYRGNNLTVFELGPRGELSTPRTVAVGANPRSVVVEPSGRFAYVVNSGANNVSVVALEDEIRETGRSASTGASPRSIAVDPSGRFAYVANSRSNDVSAYGIHGPTGRLTALAGRVPAGNGPLAIALDPRMRFAFVANYYDANVSVYRIGRGTGELLPAGPPLAAGVNPYALVALAT